MTAWSSVIGSIHPQTPTHVLDILIQTSNVIPCLAMASSRPIQGGTVPWSSQSQTATWTCTTLLDGDGVRLVEVVAPTHLLQDARHLMSPKSSIIFISKDFNHYNVCSFFLQDWLWEESIFWRVIDRRQLNPVTSGLQMSWLWTWFHDLSILRDCEG